MSLMTLHLNNFQVLRSSRRYPEELARSLQMVSNLHSETVSECESVSAAASSRCFLFDHLCGGSRPSPLRATRHIDAVPGLTGNGQGAATFATEGCRVRSQSKNDLPTRDRCSSLAPSQIWVSLASRNNRSTFDPVM